MKQAFKIIIMALLITNFAHAQGYDRGTTFNYSAVKAPDRMYRRQPAATEGTPYLYKVFIPAKVGNLAGNARMRYNAYNDEFEFIDAKNDTLVLNKVEEFKEIVFIGTNTKYELTNYTDKSGEVISGYLVRLNEKNNCVLYKRQKVNYYAAREANTSYENNLPPKFEPTADVFYFKRKDKEAIELPTSKKGLVKLYPEKKEKIEAFIKQNDINFKKEEDIIKLAEFLSLDNQSS